MTIVFSGSPVANVELADSFNTWRLTTNKILNDAASLTANNSMAGNLSVGGTIGVTGASSFSNTVNITTLSISRGTSQKVKVIGNVSSNTFIDLDEANIFDITLGANNIYLTFTNPPVSGFTAGATILLRQDSTGTRFATFVNSAYTDGLEPVLSTNASDVDVLMFFTTDGGSTYFGAHTMAAVS